MADFVSGLDHIHVKRNNFVIHGMVKPFAELVPKAGCKLSNIRLWQPLYEIIQRGRYKSCDCFVCMTLKMSLYYLRDLLLHLCI